MTEKPFAFRLERVRELRERAEDQAKEQLAAAMAERERWAGRLAQAADALSAARDHHRGAATSGASIGDLLAHQAYLERAERTERTAEQDLHLQDSEVDARTEALGAAARERQVLERLKERRAAEHRLDSERRAGAALDEIAIARHRRGGRAA